jgi:uncharacterized protein
MRKLTAFVYRFRVPILIVFGAMTLFFAWWIKDLRVNSDVVSYLPREDAAVRLFTHLDERFGGNDLAMVALKADSIFTARALSDINRLTEAFSQVSGVSSVTSLTNVMDVRTGADGGIETGKLIDAESLPGTAEGMRALRDSVMGKERYRGSLISNDATATLIIIQLTPGTDKNAVVRALQAAAPAADYPETLYFGGIPFLTEELAGSIMHDFALLIPIAAALIILTLFLAFGSARGVLVPLGSVAVSVVWVLGLMSLFKVPLTLVSDIIPAILIAVGTAPCIHILSKFDEDPALYGGTGEPAQAAFTEVGLRVILAALTIVLGFSSFIIGSYLTTIRDFGLFTSIGVCFSLLVSIMLVPAALTLMTVKPRAAAGPGAPNREGARLINRLMSSWADVVVRRRSVILAVSAVILAAGVAGIPLIQRKADFAEFFDSRSQTRRTEAFISREFGGSRPVQVSFTGDMQNPFVLKEMLRMERFMDGEGLARNGVSPADFILETNAVMGGGRVVPDDPGMVGNLMFLVAGQDVTRQVLADDAAEGQIQAMVPSQEVKELARTIDGIEGYIKAMDTRLVPVDTTALAAADRRAVNAWRAPRAAQELQWLARKRMPEAAVDAAAVQAAAARVLDAPGMAADKAAAELLAAFPAGPRALPEFQADAAAAAIELSQANVAVPEKLYTGLSIAAQGSPEPVTFTVGFTGMPLISWHLDRSILSSQAESLAIALVFIFALLAIRLRSALGGLLGLAPIVLAIVAMFGIMGYSGIPINVATVLVGAIALGIGIDYVIHFSVRFTTFYRGETTPAEAVKKTIQTTGLAIIINVLAVTMGFIALVFASLVPLRQFGILTAIAMLASGIGAFTLLPALILLVPSAFTGRGGVRRARKAAAGAEAAQ